MLGSKRKTIGGFESISHPCFHVLALKNFRVYKGFQHILWIVFIGVITNATVIITQAYKRLYDVLFKSNIKYSYDNYTISGRI